MSDLNSLTLNAALNEAVEWLTAAEPARAAARCEDLLSSYPDAVRVLSVRARALHAMGETARAAQDYARVLEITPADAQSMTGLMRCQLRLGRRREAALTARQLLDYDAGCVDAARLVREAGGDVGPAGRVLRLRQRFAAGFTAQAIADLRAILDAAPDRADLQVILAEMLWRAGLRVTTIELCQAILDAQPDCLNANVMLHALWSRAGSTDMSAIYLRAAARFDPDFRETAAWLGDHSPVPVRDVPALIDLARADMPAVAEDDERDRVAWVDQLIASTMAQPSDDAASRAADTTARPVESAAMPEHFDAQSAPDEAGVIFPPSPLDWQPAPAQSEPDSTDSEEELPAWLSGMRENSQPLSMSDWEAAVPAEDDEISREPAAEFALPIPSIPLPASPALLPDMEVSLTPLEWQPAEPEQPLPEAAPAPAATDGIVTGPPADSPPARPRARGKSRPPKAKASAEHLLSLARRSMEMAEYDQAAHYYGQLVAAGKKLDDVLADLDAATHAWPDLLQFHTLLGRVYARKGDVSAALAAYQRALQLTS